MSISKPQIAQVPLSDFEKVFNASYIDLVSSALGGKVIACSDEFFAAAANLINPLPPIRRANTFTENGAWYDGWETRRHNESPDGDWVIIRLGVGSGIAMGCEIDTAFFNGNHAPEVAVHGVFAPGEAVPQKNWEVILPRQPCGPSQRHLFALSEPTKRSYTHVKLSMYPDGGIARFRLFGVVVPVFPKDPDAVIDLAHVANGGLAVAFSDQHFGRASNLLLPGRGMDMGDGWETKRSREPGHTDWVVVKLGALGFIEKVVIDTAHFKGNFPQDVKLEATKSVELVPTTTWTEILAPQKCGPHKDHKYTSELQNTDHIYSHVRFTIIPDGGVKRLRIFGKRA